MALLDKYRLMAESGKFSFRREFGEVDRVVFTYFEYDSRTGERLKTIKKNIDSKYIKSKIEEARNEKQAVEEKILDLEAAYKDCQAQEDKISPE
tara:strand:+ start:889 stop:1170 length:282 start_codon:yes stop_codon:yes gene_type:complete